MGEKRERNPHLAPFRLSRQRGFVFRKDEHSGQHRTLAPSYENENIRNAIRQTNQKIQEMAIWLCGSGRSKLLAGNDKTH